MVHIFIYNYQHSQKYYETAQNRIEMPGYAFDPVSIYKRSEREKPGIHRAL